jgi:DNA (cytosine-5)-methyltransferase 1
LDVVSLFSGAGGIDRGFIKAGHRIVWATDKSRDACASYEKNLHIKPLCKDIRKVDHFPQAEIVVGCNPCQGFSVIGTRDPEDYRNYLYKEIIRCLRQVRPKFFVTENVKGLKSLYAGRFFELMLKDFYDSGYSVTWRLLNAKDYGVPQDRERIFIVGVRKDLDFEYQFPYKTHGEGCLPYISLRKAIGDFPPPGKGEYWDDSRFSFFYMSRNRRRSWNEVSFTIQASGRHAPLHPSSPPMKKMGTDRWTFTGTMDKYRRLSVRECACIQTFEGTDVFVGGLESQYVQVGNAVPPLLALRIAEGFDSFRLNQKPAGIDEMECSQMATFLTDTRLPNTFRE